MTFYEDLRDGSVKRVLTDKGLAMTLRKRTSTFDEATGVVTAETNTDYATVGIIYPDESSFRADQSGTVKPVRTLLLSSSGVNTTPDPGDIVVVQGREHVIIETDPIGPGGVDVVWQVRVSY